MRLASAALVIMLGNVASRLLGVVREQVIAALFGASAGTDAFTIADRIPRTLYDLVVGAMVPALVPVFSETADDPDATEFWRLVSTVLTLLSILLTGATVVLIVLAPQLVAIFGVGFTVDVQDLTVGLVRIALPVVILLGLAGAVSAVLYARRQFVAPALANASYNAGIIVVAWLLHERLGVYSLVLGILAGGFGQLAIQVIAFGRAPLRPRLNLGHPAVRRIGRLYLPVAIGVAITSVGVAIDANLASRTGEGSLSAMRFATTLVQFPLGLIATALSQAILPTLSRQAPDGGRETLNQGLRLAVLAIVPAAVGLLILRVPVIELLFQHGAFDAHDTERTAVAFLAYSPGLVAAAIDQLLIAAFYARKDTVTPNLIAGVGVVVYLIVGLSTIGPLGMPGLALANSAQIVAHAICLWVLLERVLGGVGGRPFATAVGQAAAGTALMTAALVIVGGLTGGLGPDQGGPAGAIRLIALLGLGGLTYAGVLLALRVPEAGRAIAIARNRWPARR